MKLLLYCTKAKPTLYNVLGKFITTKYMGKDFKQDGLTHPELNGKIVAECDFKVEKIEYYKDFNGWLWYTTKSLWENRLQYLSCLSANDLENYLGEKGGYAIHIKNLHIFDEPNELNDCNHLRTSFFGTLGNAPQNMMYAYDNGEKKILISIRPQWLCKILNGEKTIEVRKKVLKEMLK